MAGLFGSMFGGAKGASAVTDYDPSKLGGDDKLMLFGAMLKDAVGAYNGEDASNVIGVQGMIGARAQKAKRDAILAQLTGAMQPQYQNGPDPRANLPAPVAGSGMPDAVNLPGMTPPAPQAPAPYQYQPPRQVSGGLSVNDPRLPGMALAASEAGLNVTPLLDVLKAQQPDIRYDRGYGYDAKTGRKAGDFHVDTDKGQVPLYDSDGKFAGVKNADGSVQAAADMAGAVAGAQERQKAGYDLVSVPQSDGSTRMMPRLRAVGALGGSGVPSSDGSAGGSQFGVSQSPADAELAKLRAQTTGNRETTQPQAYAGLQDQARASEITARTLHEILGDVQDPKSGKWTPGGSGMVGNTTAGWGAFLSGVPGAAHNLQAKLDTIRAAVGFEELNKMRQNSPTGGALGQVSEQENRLLQSVRGSLDQKQDPAQLKATLRQQLDQLEKIGTQRSQLYQAQYSGTQPNAGQGRAGGGGGRSAPPAAVNHLRAHPELAAAYDAKYGQGASRSVLGR